MTPAALGFPDCGIEEVYYATLARHRASSAEAVAGGGCGSGSGDTAGSWELPTDDPEAPALGPAEASMTRRLVAEAAPGRSDHPLATGARRGRAAGDRPRHRLP